MAVNTFIRKQEIHFIKVSVGWLLIFFVYILGAASSYSGYFEQWAFRDGEDRYSLTHMLEETAHKPFVYRQLIPKTVQIIRDVLPVELVDRLSRSLIDFGHLKRIYAKATEATIATSVFEYATTYYLTGLFWFFALVALGWVCYSATGCIAASVLAPLAFAHLYPTLLYRGGYFYDPVEVFFFALSAVLAAKNKIWLIVGLAPFATLNKEAFLFWIICLMPLMDLANNSWRKLIGVALACLISGLTYLVLKFQYSQNLGEYVENHLYGNIIFYLQPGSYFGWGMTYGFPFPRGVNVLNFAACGGLVWLSWNRLPLVWRRHVKLALIINLPLVLIFARRDEVRNLSLLFVGLVVLIAVGIQRGLDFSFQAGCKDRGSGELKAQ